MKKEIKYIVGDVREPIGDGKKIICHCVNNKGRMGSGVALALLKKWPNVRKDYIRWFQTGQTMVIKSETGDVPDGSFNLGNIQFVRVVDGEILVVNMIAQHDTVEINGVPPVRYDALCNCLKKVYALTAKGNISIHIPYLMCCDLAGGDWGIVEKIIQEELCDKGIDVIAYDINNLRGLAV